VINKLPLVTSINNEQSIQGTFYITNIRMIWFSNNLDNFNVSLPWIQVRVIKIKEINKHGKIISVETGKGSVSNSFIFKFNEVENVMREIEGNYKLFIESPIFGVDVNNVSVIENLKNFQKNEKNENFEKILKNEFLNKNNSHHMNDDVEVIETNYFNEQSNMLYYLTSNQEKKNVMGDIVYSNELGLAVERLPEKMSLENMWKIIV
jgi:Bardet-Biedl syndrome 5 protein